MKPYHHGNLRAALIEEAIRLAEEQGPGGVVLREVARRAGVSHNAAYRHFADRSDLLAEVAALGMNRLADAMRAGIASVTAADTRQRARLALRAVGRSYVEFALAEPGLFAVAFSSMPRVPDETGPYELLGVTLDQCVRTGILDPARRPGAELGCWSAVHGFACLHLSGPLANVAPEQRDRDLEVLLDRIEDGLGIPA